MTEKVNHPDHYKTGSFECIDVIEDLGLGHGFNVGNAIKYLWRAGKKPDSDSLDDLRKARWYVDREIKRQEEQRRGIEEEKQRQIQEQFRAVVDDRDECPTCGADTTDVETQAEVAIDVPEGEACAVCSKQLYGEPAYHVDAGAGYGDDRHRFVHQTCVDVWRRRVVRGEIRRG